LCIWKERTVWNPWKRKETKFSNQFTDWQHSSGHQDVDGPGRDVAADDLDDADDDGDADDEKDECDPQRRFADRLFDAGDVLQTEDPDDAEVADADASRREGEGVDGADDDGGRGMLVGQFGGPFKSANESIRYELNWYIGSDTENSFMFITLGQSQTYRKTVKAA
jgi:hypothetical protein